MIRHTKAMCLMMLLVGIYSLPVKAVDIVPFTSDGCSWFPDGTLSQRQLWLSCCEAHDYSYWKGGTCADRRRADKSLKACVAATGKKNIALLMLVGVRVGGNPYLPTKFRWGYGWPYPRGYKELTDKEQQYIDSLDDSK